MGVALAADDDHMLDRRQCERLLDRGAHRHGLAATHRGVGGDHGLDGAVLEACGNRRRGEAGEDRDGDGADARGRVDGGHGLDTHRQHNRDAVAFGDTKLAERLAEPANLVPQLGKRTRALGEILVLDHDGEVVAALGDVPADARPGEVEATADEPLGPGHAARVVNDLRPLRLPAEIEPADGRIPEGGGLGHGVREHVLVRRETKVSREGGRLRGIDRRRVGDPQVVAHPRKTRARRPAPA